MALYIDDKKVGGIKELCAALSLNEKDIPYKKAVKEFEQRMERDIHGNPKRDAGGNYQTKRKIAGAPSFNAYVPALGYDVKIRFATTQRKLKDGEFSYSPTLIDMIPAEDGTAAFSDPMEFVYWYLHPWNLHSPFHQKGHPYFFEYKDGDLRSKIENDHEENLINALGFIVGDHAKSMRELRAMAKGLNFTGVDEMTDEVLKKALRDYAKKDPLDFINKMDSRETVFSGMIQDAVDKKILEVRSLNGMQRWYMAGKEILPIPYSADPLMVLKEEMATKWHLYAKDLQNALMETTVASNLDKPELDEFFEKDNVHKMEYRAELSDEQREVLKKMKEEQWYDEKIKKLSLVDITDPKLHVGTRKSYEANKEAVELYKTSLLQEEVLA